jgi:ribosomal protein S18 acetylase RimI-like enzyme
VQSSGDLELRRASAADADAIAALHADSWRRHYRGAYSDDYLDSDVLSDRRVVWAERLQTPDPRYYTLVVVERSSVIGFAHTVLDEDPTWGALLDNLHVAHGWQGRGIGTRLLTSVSSAVSGRRTGLYLWVQEQNVAAQAFYAARGGTCVGRAAISPPGGIASRLTGSPAKLRYAWPVGRVSAPSCGSDGT